MGGVTNNSILKCESLDLTFGRNNVLHDFSFAQDKNEIVGIIGPNGAGKSCILNCINGFYHPQKGSIYLEGRDLTRLKSSKIAELGVARTFQEIELYSGMTVLDNLLAARHLKMRSNFLLEAFFFGPARREEVRHREVVEDIIDFLEMEPIRKRVVGSLPFGQRKKVELGRALALDPKILLLDEPMAGMSVEEKEDMAKYFLDVFERMHVPILIVEHDMEVIMDLADRIIVIDFGVKIAEGTPDEIKGNKKAIEAYLGAD